MPVTFSDDEYSYIVYVYGFYDGTYYTYAAAAAAAAVAEYQQRIIPHRRVFSNIFQSLYDSGSSPRVLTSAESPIDEITLKKILIIWQKRVLVLLWG
jgi:hypothetical protein